MNKDDYLKYRGNCKEFSEALCIENPSLTLVRGFVWCPFNGREQHWWCKDSGGNIIDPTKKQYSCPELLEYEEFDGIVTCDVCFNKVPECEAKFMSRYGYCSTKCLKEHIGID